MARIEQTGCNPFFIITGGPGAGKTTLLDALVQRNFKCIPEVARQIIKEHVEMEGEALPWKNK
jgi:predicted ATPase